MKIDTIDHKELAYLIEKKYHTKQPLFIWGREGIGKSDVVRQVAREIAKKEDLEYSEDVENDINKEDKFLLIDVRLAQLEAVDLRGVPQVEESGGKKVTVWEPPKWFPAEGKGIIFFDEFNLAPPSIQAGAFTIIRDRKTRERKMSGGFGIIAAGNPEGSKYQSFSMSAPLLNRYGHSYLKPPEVDLWIEWALKHGIDSREIGFLKAFPEALWRRREDEESKAFPTSRTWEMLSKDIEGETDYDIINLLASTDIGVGTAHEFVEHLKLVEKHKIDFDELLNNPERIAELPAGEVSLRWAILGGVVQKYKQNPKELIKKVLKLADSFRYPDDAEFAILLCRMCKASDSRFVNRLEKVEIWRRRGGLSTRIGKFLID